MTDQLRIGLLSSHTGPLAPVERSAVLGALLAIDEVNAEGGAAGRELVPVVADYASDTSRATFEAGRLLREEGVRLIVGGYTSASRVAIQPALHEHDGILFYPTYYEGVENDPRTVYVGAVPNQFIVDYVGWVLQNLGDRLFMIGSDYIFPRTTAAVIQRVVEEAGGRILADDYVPLGQTDFSAVLGEIARARPSVVVSNLVGIDSVPAFYRQFADAGHRPDRLPIAATVTTELDLRAMGGEAGRGHFMSASYFASLPGAPNAAYLRAIAARFGTGAPAHAAQVGLYNCVRLLAAAADAVDDLGSTASWLGALPGTRLPTSPEDAPLEIAPDLHTTHPSHIGRADGRGAFEILQSWKPRVADPFPSLLVAGRQGPPVDETGLLAPGGPG